MDSLDHKINQVETEDFQGTAEEEEERTRRKYNSSEDPDKVRVASPRDTKLTKEEMREDWAKLSGMLRQSTKGKGNYTVGSATREQADTMGRAWVGNNYKISNNGRAWTSVDGMRQYRPPSYKPRLDKTQVNFERKFDGQTWDNWPSNAHVNIID
jgi:hypothetical protein